MATKLWIFLNKKKLKNKDGVNKNDFTYIFCRDFPVQTVWKIIFNSADSRRVEGFINVSFPIEVKSVGFRSGAVAGTHVVPDIGFKLQDWPHPGTPTFSPLNTLLNNIVIANKGKAILCKPQMWHWCNSYCH